ncbi:WD40 repeat-like protein [Suillus decipiens]|nr:WD40 repeat-like protein [Suillus decipiens]
MTVFPTGGAEDPWGGTRYFKHLVKIWDVKTGELVATPEGYTRWVLRLDGKTLISGSSDDSIRTWNTTTGKHVALLDGHTAIVYSVAISPNGRILASASLNKTVQLWNLDNNQPTSSPLLHVHFVNSVSFSADGKLLATGCHDKNAYSWDVSAMVKEAGLDELLLDQQ